MDNNRWQVPKGWEVKKLKDVFYINELSLPSNTPIDYQFRYIPIEQVVLQEFVWVSYRPHPYPYP